MADMVDISKFSDLFEIGVLVNAAYGLMVRNLPARVEDYIKLERKVRSRLMKLAKSEDETLMAEKDKIRVISRGSETFLNFLQAMSSATVITSAVICLGFLVGIAYSEIYLSETLIGVILVLVLSPVPLTRLSLRAISAFYSWRVEKAVMDLATTLKVHEEVQTKAGHKSLSKRLKTAMDQIEPVFERGIPAGE